MALTGPLIQLELEAAKGASVFPMLGPTYSQVALAISTSLQAWALGNPLNLALQGATVGPAGPGLLQPATTRLLIPANTSVVLAGLTGAGVKGPTASSLASVVALGVSAAFTKYGQYSGTATVGTGPDVSKIVVANTVTLSGIMYANFLSIVGPGPTSGILATGLATGLTSLLLLGTGAGIVTPAPGAVLTSPIPGVTNSMVV